MRLTAMTYNLMRLFEEKSKTNERNLIHPAEAKYLKNLIERGKIAKAQGKFINKIHFMQRIARISSSTIRAVNNAIAIKMTFKEFMKRLVDKLILRPIII